MASSNSYGMIRREPWLGSEGLGFRVLGFRVEGLGFGGLGFRVSKYYVFWDAPDLCGSFHLPSNMW